MSMRVKKAKQIFVLVIPRFEDIFHSFYASEILKGVGLASSRLNVDILLHITDRFDHRGWLDSTLLNRQYISGIIFADIDNDLQVVKKAIRSGIPCIVLNNMIAEPINYIAVDNKQAAFDVTEHFVNLGHTQIATIAGDQTTQSGLMRLDGYKEALESHNIKIQKRYIAFGDFLRTPARKSAEKLLNLADRPTAIFAASDVMALELIDVARSFNIRIPEDLSIIGFDNNPISFNNSIKLTTVNQPLVEMGRLGVENLYQITHGQARLPVKILLATEFIERNSTEQLN